MLVAARKTWLIDALSETLSRIDPAQLKEQLVEYVPADVQRILASAGIRDEHVFPTPILLEAAPTLVGYYRLLLGVPQKGFYGGGTGMGSFKSMETRGALSPRQLASLPRFCLAMCTSLADLIRQLSPPVTPRDVHELPLLTLGSFFQGANNVLIGKQATADVFLSVKAILGQHVTEYTELRIIVRNASGRPVILTLGSDPDIRVEEDFSGSLRKKVAIEIKGGADKSNAHNRAGEAEKSHQKAKREGFRDFWTIIALKGLDAKKLSAESPTTNSWFDVAQVLGREGRDWEEFRSRVADVIGIPLKARKRP
ncbi:MAG: XcyI family restriction endonuclease [Planctomycetaceae bacterium]